MLCGSCKPGPTLLLFPKTLSTQPIMALSMPPTKCPCSGLQVAVNAHPQHSSALIPMLSPFTAPGTRGPHLTRGISITNHHKPLALRVAALPLVPGTPYSGSEMPRGPHPGTGHRNRTVFSPEQAEALEKGSRAGVGSVALGGNRPKACRQRLRGRLRIVLHGRGE